MVPAQEAQKVGDLYMCPHTATCVLILNTSIQVCKAGRRATPACCAQESYQLSKCPHTAIFVSTYYYMCVLMLLSMCPHITICAFMLALSTSLKPAFKKVNDV